MNTIVYEKLITLCIDICKRNGKKKLLWLADKDKTLSYMPKDDEMVLTVHRWFANKSCPGEWLYERLQDLAKKVTEGLKEESTPERTTVKKKYYRVQVDAFTVKSNAENMLKELKLAGFSDAYIKYGE